MVEVTPLRCSASQSRILACGSMVGADRLGAVFLRVARKNRTQ
jgi:hypothetical protein